MSAALYLKQSIYQLPGEDLVRTLDKYYSSNSHRFSVSTTQKAYKCFECCVQVDGSKYCAGFGRNEEEATLNAGRIALESIIDSGDTQGLRQVLQSSDSELDDLLAQLELSDCSEAIKKEKVELKDLQILNIESLRAFLPAIAAGKIHSHFHPSNSELTELRMQNEVLII